MFPHAPSGAEHFSPGPVGNTGDGLRLAEGAGGRIEDTLPNAAAWVPVSITERKDGSKGVMPHFIDRAKPGVIAVMRDGRRFANEGNSYHDFVQAMVKAAKPGEEITAYLVCDHRALRKYGLGCVPPFPMPLRHHLATGYLKRGTTLAELADRTGIDRQGLEATIAEFNASAAEGRDPAFGKGSRAYNRYQGDALHGPNPCVAPIKDGPFYAIKLVIGDLGTYAGIRTDEHARALDEHGQPIAGLYAAGNDMASIMGGNYPGAGITLDGAPLAFTPIGTTGYALSTLGTSNITLNNVTIGNPTPPTTAISGTNFGTLTISGTVNVTGVSQGVVEDFGQCNGTQTEPYPKVTSSCSPSTIARAWIALVTASIFVIAESPKFAAQTEPSESS